MSRISTIFFAFLFMNYIDLFLFLIILLSVFSGFQKGFLRGAVDLLLALSLIFAFWAFKPVAGFFEKHLSIGVWTTPLAFILCYVFARSLLAAGATALLRKIPQKSEENIVNKSLGIIPGVVNGIIYAAIISSLLLAIPVTDGISAKTRESSIANALLPHVAWAEDKLFPVFNEAFNHSINKLTVKPGSAESYELPFSVNAAKPLPELEAAMLDLVNQERQKEGLKPLVADPEMLVVARAHSQDMFARSYFSHVTPDGKTLSDRTRAAGVRYLVAGENLALAQTLQMAHTGLMNSPGHRANILQTAYGRVGIGILDGGRHGIMVTQNFRN